MRPEEVANATNYSDQRGDAADQAERLSMIMEAEAIHSSLNGGGGEGALDMPYPLEDVDDLLSEEDATEDASNDPMHNGGNHGDNGNADASPFVSAEEAAMHVVDGDDPTDRPYFEDEAAEVEYSGLTPEDETLLGVDPYES